MTTELKPCPFCGGESAFAYMRFTAEIYRPDGTQREDGHFVSCTSCGVSNQGVCCGYDSQDKARELWNRRSEQSSAPASDPAVPEGYTKAYLPVSDEARLKALPQCISGPCKIEEAPERTHWEVYTPYCMVLAPNEHAADYIAGNLNMLFAVLNDPMTFTKSE